MKYFIFDDYMNIKVFKDNNMWCALIDKDLESIISGFGITPVDAIKDLCDSLKKESMVINYEICNY